MDNYNNIFDSGEGNNVTPPKKKFKGSKILVVLALIIAVLGVFALGMLTGHLVYNGIAKDNPMVEEVYKLAKRYYIEDVTKDEFDIIFSAGMLTGLDRYTGLILADSDTSEFGFEYTSDNYNNITVSDVKDGSDMYGQLMRGDKILSFKTADDGEWTEAVHLDANVFRSYMKQANMVFYKVQRGEEVLELGPFRRHDNVSDRLADYKETGEKGIGYIKLDEFTTGAADDFIKAADEFVNSPNLNNIMILDLRNNPGGSTIELARILNMFIDKSGRNEVLNIKDKKGNDSRTYTERHDVKVDGRKIDNDYIGAKVRAKTGKEFKLVLLANDQSASAAEAFIGNILHYMSADDYLLLGESRKTFGKGIAQGNFPLTSNPNYILHMTIGYYYVHGPKNTTDENKYINIHDTGYTLDDENITLERKPNILEESAVKVGIAKAKEKFGLA